MSLNFYDEEEDTEKGNDESLNKYIDLFNPFVNESPNLKEELNFIYSSLNLSENEKNKIINDITSQCDKQMNNII